MLIGNQSQVFIDDFASFEVFMVEMHNWKFILSDTGQELIFFDISVFTSFAFILLDFGVLSVKLI